MRKTLFYRVAKAAGHRLWTPPIYTGATNQLAFTVAMPVRDREGRFAGVSAIVLPIVELMRALEERTLRRDQAGANSLARIAQDASRGDDELAALAASFNAMVPRLERGLRMQQGLELARAVQRARTGGSAPTRPTAAS